MKLETLCIAGTNVKKAWGLFWTQFGKSLKMLSIELLYDLSVPCNPGERKTYFHIKSYINIHRGIIENTQHGNNRNVHQVMNG